MTDTKKSIFQRRLLGDYVPMEGGTPVAPSIPSTDAPTAAPTVEAPKSEFQRRLAAPAVVTQVPKSEAAATLTPEQNKPLSVRDLYTNDAYQKTMRNYLKLYAGEAVEGLSNEDVADKYLNRMRSWSAGNSMTVVEEVYDLGRMGDAERAVAGDAYKLFDSMGNIFGKQATWADTADGLFDYAWSTIVDPTNIAVVLGGTGIVTRFGTKGAGATAKAIATKAAADVTKKALARKASTAVARAEGAAAFNVTFRKAMSRAGMKAVLGKEAKQKLIATTALDTATALGVDYAYQSGMIKSGAQEEYSPLQSGLTALGALGGGMISGAIAGASKVSSKVTGGMPTDIVDKIAKAKSALPSTSQAAAQVSGQNITLNLDFALQTLVTDPLKATSKWEKKVARGKVQTATGSFGDLSNDTDFWNYVLIGNKDAGVTGLAESIFSAGISVPAKTNSDDGIMDFLTNVIRHLPDEYVEKMQNSFTTHLGKNIADYKDLTAREFADVVAEKFSSYGRGLNVASQVRKLANTYVSPTAGAIVKLPAATPSVVSGAWDKMGYIQSLFLRAVTAHPATTMLNAKGHMAMIMLDDASDVVRAAMHTGLGFFSASQKEQAKAIRKSLAFRQISYLDPKATKEVYDGIITSHPDLLNKMMRYNVDGADNIGIAEDFEKQFGFKLEDTKFLKYGDKMTNAAQTVWLGKALDGYTKSMAFVPNLDKHLRLKFGADVGLLEFYDRPDLVAKMGTQDYVDVMATSYEDTMRMLMSLPADAKAGPLQAAAAMIERASTVPFVGTAIPFGRFFNNTIRVMSDYTGFGGAARVINIMANGAKKKLVGGADIVAQSNRDTAELISRGVVGWSIIGTLMGDYEHNLAAGLKYNQDFDEQGNIVNRQYEYPENFIRAAAASMYYYFNDAEMPEELVTEMATDFGIGNMTRQLSNQEEGLIGAVQALRDTISDPENADISLKKAMQQAYSTFGVGYVSGMMRPIDPINQAAAMYRGDEYAAPDRKQGMEALNNSLRYVDQIFAVLTETATGTAVDLAPAKRVATRSGDIQLQPTQVIGRRTMPPLTTTEKIFNQIGRPLFSTGVKSPVPAANNGVNEIMAPILEYKMKLLEKSKAFQEADLTKKQGMVNNALSSAKTEALQVLRESVVVEDKHVASVFDLTSKFNKKKVEKAMLEFADTFNGRDLYDLSPDEVDILTTYLEAKEEYNKDY